VQLGESNRRNGGGAGLHHQGGLPAACLYRTVARVGLTHASGWISKIITASADCASFFASEDLYIYSCVLLPIFCGVALRSYSLPWLRKKPPIPL
jgi:hypothetical protein